MRCTYRHRRPPVRYAAQEPTCRSGPPTHNQSSPRKVSHSFEYSKYFEDFDTKVVFLLESLALQSLSRRQTTEFWIFAASVICRDLPVLICWNESDIVRCFNLRIRNILVLRPLLDNVMKIIAGTSTLLRSLDQLIEIARL